jgi:hypothetical protein
MQRRTNKKIIFTKKALEAIPPNDANSPSREAEWSDTQCTGLRLRVSKGVGKKFFHYRYSFSGRKYCLNIGQYPDISIQDARGLISEWKLMIAKGRNPSTEKNKAKAEETFEQFAAQYLEYARQRIKTHKNQQYLIDRILIPAFGKLRLSAITPKDVALLQAKEKERTSGCSANHVMSALRTMLNIAVKWGVLEKNPCCGMTKYFEPLRERYLSKETELPRFIQAISQEDDTLSKAAILLLLFTGCHHR